MVAIVTGNGVGLGKSSSEVLGQGGQLGLGQLPGAAGNAYFNASNGNLIIQRQDELLIGRGPDIGVYQTYNSQGTFDFDNNDNWQVSLYRQLSGRTGTLNAAGSTITRTGADGTPLIYTYDSTAGSATLGKYVNKDGSGSFDTLTYTSGSNTWVWQDGNSRIKESYAVDPNNSTQWRITSVTDLNNNSLTYTYSTTSGLTSLIDKVTSANGEFTQLIYNSSKQLTQINFISSSGVTTTRIRYTYESTATTARLTSVSTDLTPADGSIADGKTYTTTYTYDGTSKRIASITNSDGSKVSFTYETSGSFRLLTINDYVANSSTINNTTTLNYTSATTTTVTNTNNAGTSLVTTLTYDTNKQLTNVQGPSGSGQNVSYTYNSNGDVTQVTDSRGNWTKYTYDSQGNQLTQQDNLGNTIVRTYDSTATGFNQLLTETVYTGVDATPGSGTTVGTGTAQTTRYTYDSKNHVRFIISAEGRVTEYRYSISEGQLNSTHQYTENQFTATGNQTEAQMNTWLTTVNKSKSQRMDYLYDSRGQLTAQIWFTAYDEFGEGVVGNRRGTYYVYDNSGNLLQKIDPRGVDTPWDDNDFLTSYSYDGLNRLTLTKQYSSGLESDAISTVTTYNDGTRQVALTLANGLVTTSTYDLAGRLITVQKSDSVNTTAGSLGTTSYAYDKLGNLRMVTDPAGQSTYYLYDNLNRKVGEIDQNKNLTEWVYNNNGQVIRTIQYRNAVTATLNATTALTNTLATAGIRPAADATNDRTSYRVYDKAGKLSHEIDALGYVTEYQYDGASRLLRTLEYNAVISAANLDLIKGSTTDVYGINGSIKGISGIATTNTLALTADATNDRANRNLYDNDGKLVGSLDAEGYLTEYVYDKAGRQTQKIRYATVTLSTNWATGNLAILRGNATNVPADTVKHQSTNYIYDAAGQLTGMVDAENYVTLYNYDTAGNQLSVTRYTNKMVGTLVQNTLPEVVYSNGTPPTSSNYVVSDEEDHYVATIYDFNNRLVYKFTKPGDVVTEYYYDSTGNLLSTRTISTYDLYGEEEDSDPTRARIQNSKYDSRGNLVAELNGVGSRALINLGEAPTQAQMDSIWNTYGTRYAYDTAGRLISKIEPNHEVSAGNKTRYYYDNEGKLTYTINAKGEVSQTVYNSFDQVAETRRYNTRIASATLTGLTGGAENGVASAITGISSGGYSNVQVAYDKRGQTVSTTDELLNVNSRTYNAFGELNNRTDKIDSTTNVITGYQYDRRGLLKTTTEDAAGINRITQAVYDAFGRVTQTTDGRNNIQKYQYDRLGREVITTDNSNQNTVTTYDAFSRVLTRTDGRNNTTTYSYDMESRSMTMTTAENISVVTTKNEFGDVVKVIDGRGNETIYAYNADGQLIQQTEADGAITTSDYDTAGRVWIVTDAKGIETIYRYDEANRLFSRKVETSGPSYTTLYYYDGQGRQNWERDASGVWTRMDYDAKGQVTAVVVDPLVIATSPTGGTMANPTGLNLQTSYTYDARGKKLTVVEGDATASARTTKYVYDKLGRLTSSILDPGTNKLNLTTSYTYDKNDNVVLRTDAGGNKTVYTYDANNRLVYTVDAIGYVTKRDYDANGNILTTTNYSTALAAATLTTLQTTVVTSAQSNAAVTVSPTSDAMTDKITRQVFDKENRLSFKIDANHYVTRYGYDASGNVVETIQYDTALTAAPAAGVAPTVDNGNERNRITLTIYDAMNRATYTIDAEKYVTHFEYDLSGNVIKKTRYAIALTNSPEIDVAPTVTLSGNDQVTQYTYDDVNRLTDETRAFGSAEVSQTHYEYDEVGNQIRITEAYNTANTRITQQKFDRAGRKTEVIDGEGKSTKTEYNAAGDIVKVTDALNNIGYFYTDAAGRVTLQVDPEGAVTQNQYDNLGNVTQVLRYANKVQTSGTGALNVSASIQVVLSAPGGNSVYVLIDATKDQKQTIEYDKLGQKLTIKIWTGLTSSIVATDFYTESFTYDAFGNALTVQARNGAITTYAYDKLNRQLSETLPVTTHNFDFTDIIPVKNTFTYDGFGNLIEKIEADGALTSRTTTYDYDKLNKQVKATQNLGNGTYAITQQTYDARGNLVSEKDANGSWTYYYYDNQNRRTASVKANGSYTTWTYDALGNITQEKYYANVVRTRGTATLSATSSIQLVSSAPTSGNVVFVVTDAINDRTTYYTYDKVGRQTSAEIRNITTTDTFNAGTQQYQVVTGNITTTTQYDALGNITNQTDAQGNVTRSWYNKAGQLVAKLDAESYLTIWTRDVYGNISQETRYANKVLTIGTATLDSGIPEVLSATPTGNRVYVLQDNTNDRTAIINYDKLNRVSSETVINLQAGSVNATTGVLTAATSQSATTSYQYDGLNNITQKTDATNAITNWIYDALGREISRINPQFTDFQGDLVRARTDKEYDGLNNLTREIRRGKDDTLADTLSGQEESDDQITTYTYNEIGGRLINLTTSAGDSTNYEYDLNGNVLVQNVGKGILTTYTYDVLNRQITTTVKGLFEAEGVVQEVQYNNFDQVTGKRTYATDSSPATPNTWDEFTQYDQAGRVWRSNAGDGITKIYVNDKNGNATVRVTSQQAITMTASNQTTVAALLSTANSLQTMSFYDKKNQLLKTVQATMDANRQVGSIVTSSGTASLVNETSPLGTSINPALVTNPINAGTTKIISANMGLTGSVQSTGSSAWGSGTMVSLGTSVTIPNTEVLGTGATRVEITWAIEGTNTAQLYLSEPGGSQNGTLGKTYTRNFTITTSDISQIDFPHLRYTTGAPPDALMPKLTVKVYRQLPNGSEILLGEGSAPSATNATSTSIPNQTHLAINKKLFIQDQPTSTNKVLFAYRLFGSTGAYTTVSLPQLTNSSGDLIPGYFTFDKSIPTQGDYEYQYVALNSNGEILNQQSGRFDTTTAASPTLSVQTPMPVGGLGRAFINTSGLQLIDQGLNAASVSMRYRVKGSTGSWTSIAASNFIQGSLANGYGPGAFSLASSALSALGNGTYEVEFEVRDSSAKVLRTVSSEIVKNAGALSGDLALNLKKFRLGPLPTNTAYVDIAYRGSTSTAAYGTAVRIYPTAANSGYFDWDISALPAGNQDVEIKAYNASNQLIRHYQSYITFGSNSAVVNAVSSKLSANASYITINPPNVSNIDYLVASYRLKGSGADFVPMPKITSVLNNGVKEFRAELPILNAGEYEYQYTAYEADVANYVDPASVTITPPAGTPVGASNIQVKYATKAAAATNTYTTISVTQVTSINGVTQYKLNLPSPLSENEYVFEYKTYTLVDDLDSPDYGTYQWTSPTVVEFKSDILTKPRESNIGAFTILANGGGISNTQSQWQWTSSINNSATIQRQQSYNAFGEVASETDGRGNVTQYSYNVFGKLTRKQDPSVSVTLDNGFKQTVTPQTSYTYDLLGRIIATEDANGRINTQSWMSGSELVQLERHADNGIKASHYDVFGNKRIDTDELGKQTKYAYDYGSRLVEIQRPSGVYDRYGYDLAGNRTSHTNAYGETERTDYDGLGRVVETISFMGFSTKYAYTYLNNVVNIDGGIVGGWQKTTTNAVGRTAIDTMDMFERIFKHQDLGGNIFNYNFNRAGWLTSQTSTTGQNIAFDYYANGFTKSVHDKVLGMYTFYEYDQDGNKSFEGYVSLKDPLNISAGYKDYYQQAAITYDALNRITKIEDPKATITYEYDAVGNRRMMKSVYSNGVNGALQVQEYWYKYDSMNRFLITMGELTKDSNGNTVRGTSATDTTKSISTGSATGEGAAISYNLAGQRVQAAYAKNNSTEAYTYNDDGYLTDVRINNVLRSRRTNDLLGRVTHLTEYGGNGTTVSYAMATTYDLDSRTLTQQENSGSTTTFAYYSNNKDSAYAADGAGELALVHNSSGGTIVNTYYGYTYWDEAKVTSITADPYNRVTKKNDRLWKNGYSDITYDVNGHIKEVVDRVGKRNLKYVSDAQGLILVRDEITGTIDRPNYRFYESTYNPGTVANKIQRFYYIDGKAVGDVGNDGPSRTDYVQAMADRSNPKGNYAGWKPVASADFDQNYEPVGPTNPGLVLSTYVVKAGDTLQSIAATVWGDAGMWYLLADANGLNQNQTLEPNTVLTVPNKITNVHNNAGTFRPYNPGERIGDLNPTIPAMPQPPKQKKKCGGLAGIIVAIVTVAVAIISSNYQLIPQALATTLGSTGATIASAAVSASLGNIAGQATANLLGVQKGFNFTSLATAAVTAGVTQGLIGGTPLPDGAQTMGLFGDGIQSALSETLGGFGAVAARAMVNNVVSQGVSNITGLQKGFSWSSVAAAGVGAAVGAFIGDKVGRALKTTIKIGNSSSTTLSKGATNITAVSQGVAANVATQLTQITLDGKGKITWANVAVSGVGAGVGALAGYNDPKNGGALSGRDIYLDNSTAVNEVGTTLDVPIVTVTGKGPVTKLVDETANQLMRVSSGQQFVDYAAEKVRSTTGSNLAGFITYTLGNTINNTINAPRVVTEALKYGYTRGGEIGSAMYQDPLNAGIGIGKSILNFGPEAFNGATNLTKMSLNGLSYGLDAFGSDAGKAFRATDAYNLPTQRYNGDAQLGGGIFGNVAGALTPVAATKVGQLTKAINANKGLRSSTVISSERAESFLVKNGMSADRAANYIASFDGPITARLVRPGEDFLRYTDVPNSSGHFLTKTVFSTPERAVEGLYLGPYGNNASLMQSVTATQRSIVFEGSIANGGAGVQQSVVINRNNFQFGIGKGY